MLEYLRNGSQYNKPLLEIDPAIETHISHQAGVNALKIGSERISDMGMPVKRGLSTEDFPSLTFPPNPPINLTLSKVGFAIVWLGTGTAAAYLTYNFIERFAGR